MPSYTVAPSPDRDRLERRLRRIELTIAALRERAVYRHPVIGTTPPPLGRAIGDFEAELVGIRKQLNKLGYLGPTRDLNGRENRPSRDGEPNRLRSATRP